jgi:hypothetical protein
MINLFNHPIAATEENMEWLVPNLRIREISGSNIGPANRYLQVFAFASGNPDRFYGSLLKYTSDHFLPQSFQFTIH